MTNVRLRVPILAIAVAAVALYAFGKWQASQGAESGAIIRSAEQALAVGKAYRARQAQLVAVARAQADSAAAWKRRAQARDPRIAQLDTALAQATTVRDSNVVLGQQNLELRGQVAEWEAAFGRLDLARLADSTRADRAEARVALLEQNLATTLTVADCHLAGLKFLPRCPSRLVSAALGAGVTAVAFVATRH
jgi:hypothetical protein